MTPELLAIAKVKGHLIGLVIIAWFIISKGLAIDRAQYERNRKLADKQ